MMEILNFLKPASGIGIWAIKHGLLILGCFLLFWILCLILSRVDLFEEKDIQLKVYFGCMVPLLIYLLSASALLLITAYHDKQTGISLGYCMPYLAAAIITWCLGWQLSRKISKRIVEKERRGTK